MNLLCLGGDHTCARGRQGPHWSLLQEFHHYWDRIDYLCPYHPEAKSQTLFGNVHFHVSCQNRFKQKKWLIQTSLNLTNQHPYHLIAAHDYPPFINGLAAKEISKKTSIPYISEIYHIEGYPKASSLNEWCLKILTGFYVQWINHHATAFRVINKQQVPNFLTKHGVDKEKIKLIYSSYTDFDIFFPSKTQKDIDVLFIGRLTSNKGLWNLVNAIKNITPHPRTHLIGVGPLEQELINWVRKNNLQGSITFHGWAKNSQEIASWMNRSHCVVCCSLSEGGPRTTLEAMACAVPVITTPVGTMPDLIEDKINGLMIDFDSHSLRKSIRWLLDHPQQAVTIGEKGRESIPSFERKKLIKTYAQEYQSLAQQT